MAIYSVTVTHVGRAFTGTSFKAALDIYNACKKLSQEGYGKIAGEVVCLSRDATLLYEYMGNVDEEYETVYTTEEERA